MVELRRSLTIEETRALSECLAFVTAEVTDRQPVLSDLSQALLDPSEELAKALYTDTARLTAAVREVGLALQSLTKGAVAGMFDGPTSVELDPRCPVTVMDLSGVTGLDEQMFRIVMLLTAGWVQSVLARRDGIKRLMVIDEAHRMMRELSLLRWLSVAQKIGRQDQVAFVYSMHRYSDLLSGADDGSETVKLAMGLLSDCEVRICYRQEANELELVKSWTGLTEREVEILKTLPAGQGLWHVGRQSHVVQHRRSELEKIITDTNTGVVGIAAAHEEVRRRVSASASGD